MLDKLLTLGGNALLGCALVVLAAPHPAFAQEAVDPGEAGSGPGSVSVPLRGLAVMSRVAGLTVSPDALDTGVVEIGSSVSTTLTLTHDGAAGSDPIAIGEARLFGKNRSDYTIDFNGFVTLYPGDVQPMQIGFTPQVPGQKSAGLMLRIDGISAPVVVLFEGSSRYPKIAEIGSSADSLKFGQILAGQQSAKSVTLTNIGDPLAPPLFVSDAQINGEFASDFSLDFQPMTLQPGDSQSLAVTLAGGSEGNKTGTLSITHDGGNPTLSIALQGEVVAPAAVPIGFSKGNIDLPVYKPTTLAFGPDGKLYVGQQDGAIHVFDTARSGKNAYSANKLETIDLIKNMPNRDDDGEPNPSVKGRQVTGIHLTGSAGAPIIWAASTDPRHGGAAAGTDTDLDTNSGILHKLTKSGGGWQKQDVVRGLPRSEENHGPNGLLMHQGKLIIMSGGFTNQGMPSNNFAEVSEYALSAAALQIDVDAIGSGTYDLPTLDDEDRPGADDEHDPFGGNNGKNQAKLVKNGPVQIWSTGLRNAYDVVLTEAGRLYTFDNGPNSGWGGTPQGDCLNRVLNGGSTLNDSLHLLTKGSHAGHPNPVRGNTANTFNDSNPQSPVEIAANPVECAYASNGMTTINASSNGIAEYTADNFGNAMAGDLIVASYGSKVYRIQLNGNGTKVTSKSVLFDTGKGTPLDVIAQGDSGPYPGTIWVLDYVGKNIHVYEPDDY